MLQTVRIIVSGKVQGVFFRKYTFDVASKLGVTGYVMNMPGGNVKIEASGDEKLLEDLVSWCRSGSPGAEVEEVEVTKLPLTNYSGFTIRYS